MLLPLSPAPHGNKSDKKQAVGAGAQQCTLELASGAGLYAEQSADPKSLLIALGMVRHGAGAITPSTRFTRRDERAGEGLGGLGRSNSCPGPDPAPG